MPTYSAGFITARDQFVIDFDKKDLLERMEAFADARVTDAQIRKTYFEGMGSKKYPDGDTRGWKLPLARRQVRRAGAIEQSIRRCLYRPFDERFIFWSEFMIDWPRPEVMGEMANGRNIALLTSRMTKGESFAHVMVSRNISEVICLSSKTSNNAFVFPLNVHDRHVALDIWGHNGNAKRPGASGHANFSQTFMRQLGVQIDTDPLSIAPMDVFSYIYAVLHIPEYRSRYSEYLRIDFPRIPMPGNRHVFLALAELGAKLVSLHLMEASQTDTAVTYVGPKNPTVENVRYDGDMVWLDKKSSCGFAGVSSETWEFHVGGYRVCEKWLKSRRGRRLRSSEIDHYKGVVSVLSATVKIMKDIDRSIDELGGLTEAFK